MKRFQRSGGVEFNYDEHILREWDLKSQARLPRVSRRVRRYLPHRGLIETDGRLRGRWTWSWVLSPAMQWHWSGARVGLPTHMI